MNIHRILIIYPRSQPNSRISEQIERKNKKTETFLPNITHPILYRKVPHSWLAGKKRKRLALKTAHYMIYGSILYSYDSFHTKLLLFSDNHNYGALLLIPNNVLVQQLLPVHSSPAKSADRFAHQSLPPPKLFLHCSVLLLLPHFLLL